MGAAALSRRIYIDTSLWVAMLTSESQAASIKHWIGDEPGQLCVSPWTRTELASALAIKHRRGELTQDYLMKVLVQFDAWVARSLRMLSVESHDCEHAAGLCAPAVSGLRAGDALHLAVALRHRCSHMATLDAVLIKAASNMGLRWIGLNDDKKFTD